MRPPLGMRIAQADEQFEWTKHSRQLDHICRLIAHAYTHEGGCSGARLNHDGHRFMPGKLV